MEKYITAASECIEHAQKLDKDLYKTCSGVILASSGELGLGISGSGGLGVMLARKKDGTFSAPIAVSQEGWGVGATIGAQKKIMVIVLGKMATERMYESDFKLKVGATAGFAAGPVGRELQAELAKGTGYSYVYVFTKGAMINVQLENNVIWEVHDTNVAAYGKETIAEIVEGDVEIPEEAKELMEKAGALLPDAEAQAPEESAAAASGSASAAASAAAPAE